MRSHMTHRSSVRRGLTLAALLMLMAVPACTRTEEPAPSSPYRTFATPEEATDALIAAAKAGNLEALVGIFGPEGKELAASSDPTTARMNREVFTVAARERKQLVEDSPTRRTLVIGNEDWPFPVPIVKEGDRWRFDTAAGKEEVIARRIGRNELSAIAISRAYVGAQRRYAAQGHDGKPKGLYAMTFRSDAGKQNGLYWPAAKGQKLSPLGDLAAKAAEEGTDLGARTSPEPLHGYYFKILKEQGAAAPGGAKNYVVKGVMSGGFALAAWPAQYDASGVMTFIVGPDGIVREKDLGPETDATARAMTAFNPDESWQIVE
jgi:Protein of unknown function (DUF2950)